MMDELQISEATPFSDGSYSSDLIDSSGNVVATITRLANGTAQADVSSSAGGDIAGWLKKASSFLDGVANAARGLQSNITRVENAAAGAKAGFNLPTTATPYLIAIGVLGLIVVASTARASSRRD